MGGGGGSVAESPAAKASADLAQKQWEDYKKNNLPMEHAYANSALHSNQLNNEYMGAANATAAQTLDAARSNANQAMFSRGIAPNSGAFVMGNTGARRASGVGAALAAQDRANQAHYVDSLAHAVSTGKGLSQAGTQGLQYAAGIQQANDIASQEAQNIQQQAMGQAIGSGVGMYVGARGLASKVPATPVPVTSPSTGGFGNYSFNKNQFSNGSLSGY